MSSAISPLSSVPSVAPAVPLPVLVAPGAAPSVGGAEVPGGVPSVPWRDPALVETVIGWLVASAKPAVAFSGLAAAGVPALADECVIVVAELAGAGEESAAAAQFEERADSDEPASAAFTIRFPTVRSATVGGQQGEGSSVTATVEAGPEGGELGYRVTATFGWSGRRALGDADQVIADLLLHTVADQVSRQRLVSELEQARDKVNHLGVALESNRRIGQALGILMATYKLTDECAFDLLRGVSQHTHRKLRDIADEVCTTGTLDLTDHQRASRRHADGAAALLRVVDGARR